MLNKIMVIGNLGTDPEMRYTPSGSAVTNFRMAVSRSYTASDGERREETEWFTIVAWNQVAEQVNQYLYQGPAGICGRTSAQQKLGGAGRSNPIRQRNKCLHGFVLGQGSTIPRVRLTG